MSARKIEPHHDEHPKSEGRRQGNKNEGSAARRARGVMARRGAQLREAMLCRWARHTGACEERKGGKALRELVACVLRAPGARPRGMPKTVSPGKGEGRNTHRTTTATTTTHHPPSQRHHPPPPTTPHHHRLRLPDPGDGGAHTKQARHRSTRRTRWWKPRPRSMPDAGNIV